MSNLFGSQPKVIPEFTGLQVNTSVQVLPIPIIYGSPRVSINLIYYNGFNSQLVSAGGKGILSGGKGAQQVQYFATLIMAIGEGTLGPVKIIYQDQNVWTPANFPTNGSVYVDGAPDTPPWSYIVARWPQDARPYRDTAYYGFSNAQLDSSATVPQINLVVEGKLAGTCPLNNSTIVISTGQYDPNGNPISFIGSIPLGDADADPAEVIKDFLINETYGATFPDYWIDFSTLFTSANGYDPNIGDPALSTFCQAVGLGWSVVVNNVEPAASILDRWCKNLNVAPIWNGAKLQFIPYWDRYADGNPGFDETSGAPRKYFTPYTIPIVRITLDQILQSSDQSEDPITFSRKDPIEVYNTVRLDFRDRTNFFNDNPVEVKDEAHIELYGPRTDNIGSANEFSLLTYANISATMQLRRNISIMNTYTWKMSPLWGWLDPMNILEIPDPTNYNNFVSVRVTDVEDDEEENVTIIAEAFPVGSQAPTTIPTAPTTPPSQGATNIPPSPVYKPVIFAPTTPMLTAQGFTVPQVILGASGGNAPAFMGELDLNWGGAFIWVSLDNITYQEIGTLTGPSTIGTLAIALAGYGGVNPDNINTLTVNLNESDGTLSSVTDSAAASGVSICAIQDVSGFEILAYTTATLIAPFTYALTGLYRGLYGTTPRGFGVGSEFLYVGQTANFFETALPAQYVGQTFWVKLQSFNVLHTVTEDLSTVVAYQYLATSPMPVGPMAPPMQASTYRRMRQKPLVVPRIKRLIRRSTLGTFGTPPTPPPPLFFDDFSGGLGNWNFGFSWERPNNVYAPSYVQVDPAQTPSLNPVTTDGTGMHMIAGDTAGNTDALGRLWYTGLLVSTFTRLYGYFEFKTKMPLSPGAVNGANWLYPNATIPGVNDQEEIDIVEHNNNLVMQTVHNNTLSNPTVNTLVANITDEQTYGVDWQADRIKLYLNGSVTLDIATPANCNTTMNMVMSINIGSGPTGSEPTPDVDGTTIPQFMTVKSVGVWLNKATRDLSP